MNILIRYSIKWFCFELLQKFRKERKIITKLRSEDFRNLESKLTPNILACIKNMTAALPMNLPPPPPTLLAKTGIESDESDSIYISVKHLRANG